jgi:hypothetical protein
MIKSLKLLILGCSIFATSSVLSAGKTCVPLSDTGEDDKYGCFNILEQDACIKVSSCSWETMQSYENRLDEELKRKKDWFENKEDRSTHCYANYSGNEKYKSVCAERTTKEHCEEYLKFCNWQDTIAKKKKPTTRPNQDNMINEKLCEKLNNQIVGYELGGRFGQGSLLTTSMAGLDTGKTLAIISNVGRDLRKEINGICKTPVPISEFNDKVYNSCKQRCIARTHEKVRSSQFDLFISKEKRERNKYINICSDRCQNISEKIGYLNWGMNEAPMVVDQNKNCKQVNDSPIHKIQKINHFIENTSYDDSPPRPSSQDK